MCGAIRVHMPSPTQRSLAYLRKNGWSACVVEKWNQYARVRQDAFGFGDILAIKMDAKNWFDTRHIALVQTTTTPNMAARRNKINALWLADKWRDAGGLVILHGWAKRGPRGKRKKWELTEEVL